MSVTIPKLEDAPPYDAMTAIDPTDIQAITGATLGNLVVPNIAGTSMRVTQHAGTPGMSVDVAAGTVRVAGASYDVAAQSAVAIGAASTADRRDAVVARLSGGAISIVVIPGVPCLYTAGNWARSTPQLPPMKTLPTETTDVVLAEVYVAGSGGTPTTAVTTANNIVDKRNVSVTNTGTLQFVDPTAVTALWPGSGMLPATYNFVTGYAAWSATKAAQNDVALMNALTYATVNNLPVVWPGQMYDCDQQHLFFSDYPVFYGAEAQNTILRWRCGEGDINANINNSVPGAAYAGGSTVNLTTLTSTGILLGSSGQVTVAGVVYSWPSAGGSGQIMASDGMHQFNYTGTSGSGSTYTLTGVTFPNTITGTPTVAPAAYVFAAGFAIATPATSHGNTTRANLGTGIIIGNNAGSYIGPGCYSAGITYTTASGNAPGTAPSGRISTSVGVTYNGVTEGTMARSRVNGFGCSLYLINNCGGFKFDTVVVDYARANFAAQMQGVSQSGSDIVFLDCWLHGKYGAVGFGVNETDFHFYGGQLSANPQNALNLSDGDGSLLHDSIAPLVVGRNWLDGTVDTDGIPGTRGTSVGGMGIIDCTGVDFEGSYEVWAVYRKYVAAQILIHDGNNVNAYPDTSNVPYGQNGDANTNTGAATAAAYGSGATTMTLSGTSGTINTGIGVSGTNIVPGTRVLSLVGSLLTIDTPTSGPGSGALVFSGGSGCLGLGRDTSPVGQSAPTQIDISRNRIKGSFQTRKLVQSSTIGSLPAGWTSSGYNLTADDNTGSSNVTSFGDGYNGGQPLLGGWLVNDVLTGAPTNLLRFSGLQGVVPYRASSGQYTDLNGLLQQNRTGILATSGDGINWRQVSSLVSLNVFDTGLTYTNPTTGISVPVNAYCDGTHHPLSAIFPSLAEAQAFFATALAAVSPLPMTLADEIDYWVFQTLMVDGNAIDYFPKNGQALAQLHQPLIIPTALTKGLALRGIKGLSTLQAKTGIVNTSHTGTMRKATITAVANAGGVVTFQGTNTYVAGEQIIISGLGNTGFQSLNGTTQTVISTGLSGTQFAITSALTGTTTTGSSGSVFIWDAAASSSDVGRYIFGTGVGTSNVITGTGTLGGNPYYVVSVACSGSTTNTIYIGNPSVLLHHDYLAGNYNFNNATNAVQSFDLTLDGITVDGNWGNIGGTGVQILSMNGSTGTLTGVGAQIYGIGLAAQSQITYRDVEVMNMAGWGIHEQGTGNGGVYVEQGEYSNVDCHDNAYFGFYIGFRNRKKHIASLTSRRNGLLGLCGSIQQYTQTTYLGGVFLDCSELQVDSIQSHGNNGDGVIIRNVYACVIDNVRATYNGGSGIHVQGGLVNSIGSNWLAQNNGTNPGNTDPSGHTQNNSSTILPSTSATLSSGPGIIGNGVSGGGANTYTGNPDIYLDDYLNTATNNYGMTKNTLITSVNCGPDITWTANPGAETYGLWIDDGYGWPDVGNTRTALTTGGPITSIPVTALPSAIPAGSVTLLATGHLQTFTTTGAALGATSVPVTSATPNFAYPIGTFVSISPQNSGFRACLNTGLQRLPAVPNGLTVTS